MTRGCDDPGFAPRASTSDPSHEEDKSENMTKKETKKNPDGTTELERALSRGREKNGDSGAEATEFQ